jgi:HEPN domain-containing protein
MNISGHNHRIEYITNVFISADAEEARNWKDRLTSIAAQIPEQADMLKPLIQFLVASISPAKIYMLQHKDTATTVTGGFIDLLIVISGKNNVPFTEMEPILEIAYLRDQRVSCSLHGEGNVIEGLRNGHVFYSLNCIPENLVYDDKAAVYPSTTPEAMQELKQRVKEQFMLNFKKAVDFNESAAYLHENSPSHIIGFLLHQAVELTYRGILQSLNGCDKKTHEIRSLKKHIRRCAPQLNSIFPDDTDEEKRLLDILENAYLKARYDGQYNIPEDDLSKLFDKVIRIQETAKEIVTKKTA